MHSQNSMSYLTESNLQKKVTEYLKKENIYFINVYGSGRTAKGAPDIIACVNGKFVALELKVGSNNMQPDQIIHKRRIKRSGGLHYVPRTLDEVKKIINEITGG